MGTLTLSPGPSPCPWGLCLAMETVLLLQGALFCLGDTHPAVGTLTLLWGPSSTRIHPDLAVETLIMLQGPSPTAGTLILPR